MKDVEDGKNLPQTVEKVLSLSPDEQEQFIEQAGRLKSVHSAEFLTLLLQKVTDKKLRKSIRKGLFRLKTQGIRIEEPTTAGESVLRKAETAREAQAYISNYDAEETRVVVVAFEIKKNQFVFNHAVTHFSNGLAELASFPVAKDQLEEIFKEYFLRSRPPVVLPPVSPPYAGYVIEETAGLSGKNTEEARVLKRFLNDTKGDVRRPQDICTLEVDGGTRSESLEAVLAHQIFEPFILTWTGIEGDRKKLNETVNPSIVLPPYVVAERREAFLKELVQNDRLRAKMPLLKRMLEDYAYLLYCLKEFTNYRGLAQGLKDGEAVNKALLYFVRKSIEKLEKKEQEQPGLIVDPYSLTKK